MSWIDFKLQQTSSHLPIHVQLRNALEFAISRGEIAPGTQVPSVRELATELGVAANTVAQAYRHLKDSGFLVTRAGQGTFVSDTSGAIRPAEKDHPKLWDILESAIVSARAAGYSRPDIVVAVDLLLSAQSNVLGFVGLDQRITDKWCRLIQAEVDTIGVTIVGLTLDQIRSDLPVALDRLKHTRRVLTFAECYYELRDRLRPFQKQVSVLLTQLSEESYARLATLPADQEIGIVCGEAYRSGLEHLVSSFSDGGDILWVSREDAPGVRKLLEKVDTVVYSLEAADQVIPFARLSTRLILVEDVPNPEQIAQFRQLLVRESLTFAQNPCQPDGFDQDERPV